MKGKLTYLILFACLAAFGYLFVLNPSQVEFRLFRGAPVRTNLALLVFLAFLSGFGLAFLSGLGKEALLSVRSWRQGRREVRREKGRTLLSEGRGLLALEKPGPAAKALRRAHRLLRGDASVTVALAKAEAAQGQSVAAETRLKALLEDHPGDSEASALLAEIQKGRGDVEGQQSTLARRLEVDPKHLPTLRALRDLYRRGEKWGEAVRLQEKVVARVEGREARGQERRILAELLTRGARGLPPASARAQLLKAIEEDREYAPAYGMLGEALASQGDEEGACRAWLRGYDATGQVGLLQKVEEVRLKQSRGQELLKIYKKLRKGSEASRLLEPRLLILLDRADEALDLLERLAGEGPSSAALCRLMGEALFRLRSFERSANWFKKSQGSAGREPLLRFLCSTCGGTAGGWNPTCSNCGAMDSLQLDERGPASKPIGA